VCSSDLGAFCVEEDKPGKVQEFIDLRYNARRT